jgi:hypothetical protein
MSELLAIALLPLLWFAVAAAALLALSGVYVRALLLIARLPTPLKVTLPVVLWIAFSALCVSPLFGWLSFARLHLPAALELPAMLWPLACFGLCFPAVYRPVKLRLPQLQAAGFFKR